MKEKLLNLGIDEEMSAEIEEILNEALEEKNREIESIKLDYEIDNVLREYDVKTSRAVRALLDTDSIAFDEKGGITGIREQLDKLKGDSETEYLFGKRELKGTVPAESYDNIPDVENMNYTQLCAYFDKNGAL